MTTEFTRVPAAALALALGFQGNAWSLVPKGTCERRSPGPRRPAMAS